MSRKTDTKTTERQGGDNGERNNTAGLSESPESSAIVAWDQELSLYAEAGRQVMIELHEATGLSQDRAAEVIRSLIPARVKRGMTGATLSRYSSDAEHFWHVPFLVLLSMLRAYRVSLRDYIERVHERALVLRYGSGDPSALGAQLATESELTRLRERSVEDQKILDAIHLLTPAQRADKLVELTTLAARNQEYRAESIAHGYPTASDTDVELGGGLMGALSETDAWAENLREQRRSHRKSGNDHPAS